MILLQVLNYLLDTKDSSLLTLNNIDERFFSDYRQEFNFIKTHFEQFGNVPDKETFLNKFSDFDVIQVYENSSYLITALYEDFNKRNLALTFNGIRSLLMEGKTDDAMTLFQKASEEMSTGKSLEAVDIFKDVSRYDAYVERCEDYNKYYVTTGLPELDEVIGGWDRTEELATIVARTNQGKTWLLLKTAVAAAKKGLTVGLYSGEMSENKVGYRIDTLISHISNYLITKGKIEVQNDYLQFINELKNGMYKGTIKVLTPANINGPAGVTALRAFIEKEHLDMLCIDLHSLLDDDRKAKNPVEKAANISKDLKNLQVLKRIPIISVCLLNRSSTEEGIDTTHIAQSDRIGQDSTVVLAFEQKDGILNLTIIKSRDSQVGKKLLYHIDFDKGEFVFVPSDSDATDGKHVEDLKNEYVLSGEGNLF